MPGPIGAEVDRGSRRYPRCRFNGVENRQILGPGDVAEVLLRAVAVVDGQCDRLICQTPRSAPPGVTLSACGQPVPRACVRFRGERPYRDPSAETGASVNAAQNALRVTSRSSRSRFYISTR